MNFHFLTRIEQVLDNRAFAIEVVSAQGRDIYNDLKRRLEQGERWHCALLAGISSKEPARATGLLLLKEPDNNVSAGVLYTQANCGNEDEASLMTAKTLTLLDEWYSTEGLQTTVTSFERLRITKLGINAEPVIEPLS